MRHLGPVRPDRGRRRALKAAFCAPQKGLSGRTCCCSRPIVASKNGFGQVPGSGYRPATPQAFEGCPGINQIMLDRLGKTGVHQY